MCQSLTHTFIHFSFVSDFFKNKNFRKMNFLKKKLTKFAKKKVKEIVTAPRDQRNPHFQKLIDDTGDFLRFEEHEAEF